MRLTLPVTEIIPFKHRVVDGDTIYDVVAKRDHNERVVLTCSHNLVFIRVREVEMVVEVKDDIDPDQPPAAASVAGSPEDPSRSDGSHDDGGGVLPVCA